MTISVDIHVVAHSSRLEIAEDLKNETGASDLWVDTGRLGEWKNHLRAWTYLSYSQATHAIVLQDDAVPVDGFRELAEKAASQHPTKMISFYVGTHRPRQAQVVAAIGEAERLGASWLVGNTLMWGVAVMVPVERIPEMLETVKYSKKPYDERLGLWAERQRENVYYTWPSLVDHQDLPSTVWKGRPDQQGVRVAHKVGVPTWSTTEVQIATPNHVWIVPSKRDLR